jgi:subtilisin family serine protease
VSVLAAAAIVTALVGLPPGTTAPPPGSIPLGAQVQVLDRQLGIVAVGLRPRDANRAIARLRRAPGVRYATITLDHDGGLASASTAAGCSFITPRPLGTHPNNWRSTIHLTKHSAAGFTVGIPDTGADLSRLGGTRDRINSKNWTNGGLGVADEVDHGTEIASLIGANRPDLHITGVAPDVGLAIARIARAGACDSRTLTINLIEAFKWFRDIGDVQIVNVSVTLVPSPALVESLRALQEAGTLVVAATGNSAKPGKYTFPAAEPHVLGVGALRNGSRSVSASSGRGSQVDLVAPAAGLGVVYSSFGSRPVQAGATPAAGGTSFATPLVSGAAALVWARHSAWDASRVAAALTMSATHLSGASPNTTSGYGLLNVKAALHATPPADLDEPNDWASAARGPGLAHKTTLAATVGGDNDPLDAYPLTTRKRSVVSIRGKETLQAYLLRDTKLASIEGSPAALKKAATVHRSGASLNLKIPRKGRWYVVVTAAQSTSPIGYTLRAG